MELVGSPLTHGLPNYLPHIVQRTTWSYLSNAAKPLYSLFNAIIPAAKNNEPEPSEVFSPEFTRSGHLAHLLKGFKEILQAMNFPENLPGPGNGYYETIYLFLDSLEQTIVLENLHSIDHHEAMAAFISHSRDSLILELEMKYPPEVIFYAIRLTSPIVLAANDLWTLFQEPSKILQYRAERLIACFEGMAKALRMKKREEFRETFLLFDQTWEEFLMELAKEKSVFGSGFSPSTKMGTIIHKLTERSNHEIRQIKQHEIEKISLLFLSENLNPKHIYVHIKYFLERKLHWLESESLFKRTLRKICQDPDLKLSIDSLINDRFSDFKAVMTQLACLEIVGSAQYKQTNYPVIFDGSTSIIDQIGFKIDRIKQLSSSKVFNTLRKFVLKLSAKTPEEKKIYALAHELSLEEEFDKLFYSISEEPGSFLDIMQKELMEKYKIITLDVDIRLWLAAEKMRELGIVALQPRMHDEKLQEELIN